MGLAGKMLNALRRDCWGCDNRMGFRRIRCTCEPTKRARQREKRRWKSEAREDSKRWH